MAFNLCRAISHTMSGGNKRYSMHCSRKASCKKLQKGLDFCLARNCSRPSTTPKTPFGILLPPTIPPVRVLMVTARDALQYQIKDPNNVSQKKRPLARLPIPIARQGRALYLGRVGARDLAKSPRFGEPMGKKGVQ